MASGVSSTEVTLGDKKITFETGRLAKQASGAVVVRSGDTMVLVTAVVASTERNVDFFPLTVDVEAGMYAAGKIPGGFIKKEGRPSDQAILNARLIDRPIRPLWPKGFNKETHIVATVLSVDKRNPYDVLAIAGASAALCLSHAPFMGPVGAVRVAKVDGSWVVNPTYEEIDQSPVNLVVAGTNEAIGMVEAGCEEVDETDILAGLEVAHEAIKKQCQAVNAWAAEVGVPKMEFVEKLPDRLLMGKINARFGGEIEQASNVFDKHERADAVAKVKQEVLAAYPPAEGSEDPVAETAALAKAFDAVEKEIVRRVIAVDKRRPDGRGVDEIRQIDCDVRVAPRTHGSGLFTRGQTQVLTLLTLGAARDEQRIDGLDIEESKRFMHHYKFPPFSVGETGFMRGPGRREIGHGALAERALCSLIPDEETFPYTIRLVSETLESNGSSSMASVCASTLALMDAGVPISRPVAGIAMGLIKEGDDYVVLTDIAGVEDHLGDMDFKVAGTESGITALQMDIKIKGVTFDIMKDALERARKARMFILEKITAAISTPRAELSEFAPRIGTVRIDPEKIGAIIGKGGETIRGMEAEFECTIDVAEDGLIKVFATDGKLGDACLERIGLLTRDTEPGDIVEGRVASTTSFGAFVTLKPGTDGLIHISRLADRRVANVEEVVNRGDLVRVEVLDVQQQGGKEKISLRLLENLSAKEGSAY
ncbi:MAG: polyribonucleotide nucleotidyltransferase [Actinobacteria bacterium]|nr:polyribonucleotide nucleotidyltransferase [Actinomycetota bacterium]